MKKFTKLIAGALLLSMVLGSTAFAAEVEETTDTTETTEETTEVEDITDEFLSSDTSTEDVDENTALVLETLAEVQTGGTYTYTDASEISRFVQLGYASNQVVHEGPFSITKGVLTTTSKNWLGKTTTTTTEVYVVALSGTDTDVENQSTGYWTDLLSGFEFDNAYNQNVRAVIEATIPAGSNLYLTGHSLGGMIAQQVASDDDIKANYNVLNTVTFGSPLINGLKREGTVKRLGDTSDVVPYLSLSTLTNVVWQYAGLNREDGGYGWGVVAAHCESYNRSDVWGAYDVTGTKNGTTTLTLDFSTTTFYASPTNY